MVHFARVTPIVGESLRQMRVALIGLPQAAPIVTYLAACGVGRWAWADSGDESAATLLAYLRAQHGDALTLDVATLPPDEWAAVLYHDPPDLIISVGETAEPQSALEVATAVQISTLLITPPTLTRSCQAISLFPNDNAINVARALYLPYLSPPSTPWDWITAAPLCAGLARAMLLRDTPYRRPDLEVLWTAGVRVLTIGNDDDPLTVKWSGPDKIPADRQGARFRTPLARRGNLLIAGLGSLGSVAAMHLAPHAAGMIIADSDYVDAYNPVRQTYPLAAVGRPKAQALHEGLLRASAENVVTLDLALTDEREVSALIERFRITAALVVTGTSADFAIARALRAHDVPHVVGRCYPRARYWEAVLVDGRRGPALSDLRGHLQPGPAAPPTPEQIAAYSDAGALEAEPATLIESGWAAAWMARLTAGLLAPPGLRERWLLELLASERTCIVGGVGVEPTANGPAYSISLPGEVHAWGKAEIRRLEVPHSYTLKCLTR